MDMRRFFFLTVCSIREIPVSSAFNAGCVTARSSLPCAVSETCRVVRSKMRNPNWRSNSRIKTLNPDVVMNNASAARVKFRWCATRWNARSWREEYSIVEILSTNYYDYELPIDYNSS